MSNQKNHKILQTISLAPATIGASNPFKSISNPFISVLLRRRRPQNPNPKSKTKIHLSLHRKQTVLSLRETGEESPGNIERHTS